MDAYVNAYNHFALTIALIRFKRMILALDLHSRRVLADKCIEFIGETSAPLRTWFEKCRLLSEYDPQGDLRKNELRSSDFWEELFAIGNAHNPVLSEILVHVLKLDD